MHWLHNTSNILFSIAIPFPMHHTILTSCIKWKHEGEVLYNYSTSWQYWSKIHHWVNPPLQPGTVVGIAQDFLISHFRIVWHLGNAGRLERSMQTHPLSTCGFKWPSEHHAAGTQETPLVTACSPRAQSSFCAPLAPGKALGGRVPRSYPKGISSCPSVVSDYIEGSQKRSEWGWIWVLGTGWRTGRKKALQAQPYAPTNTWQSMYTSAQGFCCPLREGTIHSAWFYTNGFFPLCAPPCHPPMSSWYLWITETCFVFSLSGFRIGFHTKSVELVGLPFWQAFFFVIRVAVCNTKKCYAIWFSIVVRERKRHCWYCAMSFCTFGEGHGKK